MANNTNKFLDKAGLTRLISWIKSALNSKQNVISSSNKISADYVELDYGDTVQDGIDTLFSSKQDKLTGNSSQFVKGDGSLEQYFGIYGDSKHVYNVCNISYAGYAKHFAIYTTIPYISSALMPVVTLKGFKYPYYDVESKISFYIYNNAFYQPHIQNLGAFALTAYLFSYDDNGTERVGIGLEASEFYYFGVQIDIHFPVRGEAYKPTSQWTYTYDNIEYTTETANEDRIIPPIGTNHCVKITENTLATTTTGNVKKTGDTMTGALGVPTASTASDVAKGINFKNGSTNVAHIGYSTLLGLYSTGPIYLRPNNATSSASGNGSIEIANNGISMHEVVTAEGFKKTDGTSSQFLKADGSVDSNTYLTSYTETDPTVPAWAKASTKPSYNGDEVTTVINDPRGNFSSGDSIDEALSGISNDLTAVENAKQDTLTFDTTPTANSNNPVTSGGVKAAIDALGTPNEIASITTQESSASGGNNVVTITDTDGTVTSFNVKNGIDGQDGADGVSLGEIALVQTTGDSEESVMSQKTVTNELTAAQVVKPSYFTGLMLTYLLEDYPMFDIRKCDGVSIVMDAIQYNLGRSAANFVISKGVSTSADSAFYINQVWGNLRVGLYKNYGGTVVQGMTVGNGNNAYFSHRVYTVDFLTGVCKVYKNGVLVNTLTPSSYDYSILKDFFDNTATRLSIGPGTRDAQLKTSSMAVFGHVLTDDDVTDLYGNGSDSVCGNLIPDKWKANWLIPRIITNWGTQHYNATKTTHADGGAIFTTNSTSGALLRFGFTGIPITGESAVRGNIIYEWDFEVLSGSANANYSMQNGSYAYKSWKIIDSEGNELEDGTLVEAGNTYHVINKPNNLENGYYDSTGTSLHLGYVFDTPSSDFSIWVKPELKLTERGAAIVCGPDEYKDVYWEMPNGTHIPNNKTLNLWNALGHNTLPITQGVHYGGFKDKAVVYSSSKLPQFNGQIAVDTVNGKVYIGYLTSTGGIWKLTGSGSGSGGGINEEVDPIFSASPAANITASDISKWDTGEANVQSDWNITDSTSDAFIKNKPSIPSNTLSTSYDKASNPTWPAANDTYENAISKLHKVVSDNDLTVAGALNDLENRKANSEDLSAVATSGNYNDLSNKPSAVTESTVSGWGFTKNTGTITGITMNGSSKGTSGVVNLGTVLTEHQSLTNYYTKSDIDNAGYLTSESDPTVPAHVKAITQQNITDWNNKLSSFTETDPTVPAWAKATSKPTYTASEVGAVPNTRKVNGKVLSSDISLTASDVGALPNTTVIPAAQVLSDWNATSGMGVILNKPTIPTVNNATLTILKNGTTVNTFTANASSNVTANILVNELPTVSSTDNNKILMVVNGAWTLVSPTTVYTGTSTPSSSQGINGDLYILTS